MAAVVASFWPLEITFDVVVLTDRAQVLVGKGSAVLWLLPKARLGSVGAIPDETLSGYLEPRSTVQIGVERILRGDLRIEFLSQDGSAEVAKFLRNETDAYPRTITEEKFLSIPREWFEADGGSQILLPFKGKLVLPDPDRITNLPGQPMVREGVVRLLGHTILSNRLYEAGRMELGLGEGFELPERSGSGQGFILIDDKGSMRVVFRFVGSRGVVKRFGGLGYEISASPWARLRSDEVVQALWSAFGLVFGWMTVLGRKRSGNNENKE